MREYAYLYFLYLGVQLLIEEGCFAMAFPRRRHFWLRLPLALGTFLLFGAGLVGLINCFGRLGWLVLVPYYLLVFGATLLLLAACYKAEPEYVLFAGIAGYAVQHITYAFVSVLRYMLSRFIPVDGIPFAVDAVVFHFLFYALTGYLSYRLLVKPNTGRGELKKADPRMLGLMLAVLLSSVIFSVFVDLQAATLPSIFIICRLYAIISCTLGLVVLFNISRGNRLEREKELLEYMLHQSRRQHELARENIDIINIKCHDLKYQIAALSNMDNSEQRRRTADTLVQSVMIYDSMMHSGNDAVDLILTEKSLICQKYSIKLSCIVDGKKLDFMDAADLYSLFGNALDNAIESVIKLSEEKRIISLRVMQKGEMLHIHLENYCGEPVAFADGLPVSTKGDAAFHGFGTKSIRHVVRRYDGELRISVDEERFYLDILFSGR